MERWFLFTFLRFMAYGCTRGTGCGVQGGVQRGRGTYCAYAAIDGRMTER